MKRYRGAALKQQPLDKLANFALGAAPIALRHLPSCPPPLVSSPTSFPAPAVRHSLPLPLGQAVGLCPALPRVGPHLLPLPPPGLLLLPAPPQAPPQGP